MATAVPNPLSLVLISLMKGVIEREAEPSLWQSVLELQARIRDHVAVLGLELVVDEAEGYAYLRQRPAQEGEAELPRLVPRGQLGYQVSLLLALLRKKLVEFDAASGDTRLILSREEIAEMMRLFLTNAANRCGFWSGSMRTSIVSWKWDSCASFVAPPIDLRCAAFSRHSWTASGSQNSTQG